uniref:WxL domain-containing protein n=7 Tax=Enterococcus faecalis TaxID=1351 RepID=UPI00387A63C9
MTYPDTLGLEYGLRDITITLPKWYKGLSFVRPTHSIYPASFSYRYTNNGQDLNASFAIKQEAAGQSMVVTSQPNIYQVRHGVAGSTGGTALSFTAVYRTHSAANEAYTKYNIGPNALTNSYRITYMYTTKRKVTENFVNTSGAKITPPTGFTQGKQTAITSDPYTFKQAGTLPDTYTTGGKTYKFKGWYKGKTKPSTLTTTKAPSYAVTYDDNDDLNVVYEEINFPEVTYQFGFVSEAGQLVNPADIKITYDYKNQYFRGSGGLPTDTISDDTIVANQSATTVGNLKNVTLPAAYIPRPTETGWNGNGYTNFSIKLPRYYQSLNLYDKTGKINPNYPLPVITEVKPTGNVNRSEKAVIADLTLTQRADKSFTPTETVFNQSSVKVTRVRVLSREINSSNLMAGITHYYTFGSPAYYHLTNRKVTENFVDTNGAKITAPTGFTQGKQTVINSDPYTFKQAGTLPDTYTTGGKTYKFKGWYKGKTKTEPLKTTKAPSYGVTYDDNDDLNVVYEETKEKTTTIPAVTYKFGFVDEKGALVAPTNFNMTTNLTTIMNGTPKQVGTAGGVNNGNLKQLTIPSQQLTHTPSVSPAFSGTTNFRLVVPKQYKLPTVTPGTYYTGSSTTYPIATTRFRYVGGVLPDSRLETDGKEYRLSATTTAHSYQMYRDYWIPDTTKTYFSGALSRASAEGNTPAYYTTDETMYYFLENRRVTENFVDTSGAKITPPTGFTQGKKTVISSDTYHFKLAKELPYSYYTDGKAYQFKGWYKGKTKPAKLETTRTPEYDVSYNDDDDVTTIYEEIKYGGNTVQFGFVGEDGQLINPTGFKVTTDVVQTIDGVSTTLNTLTAGNATGNLKTMTIPQKTYPLGTTANYFGTKNSLIEIPRQYLNITFKKPTDYQGKEYPVAERVEHMFTGAPYNTPAEPLYYTVTKVKNQQYKLREITWEETNQAFSSLYKTTLIRSSTTPNGVEMYPTGTIYYYLKNRRVTENFVDTSGAKITPPTGFTQGKQTAITSDPYTFKQAGTLPDTYITGGKTYKFKGWYKGKTKTEPLKTTKAPSYGVTYDDNDDLNVVYEEVVTKTYTLPSKEITFGYVDEKGNLINPANFTLKATMSETTKSGTTTPFSTITGTNVTTTNLKKLTIPQKVYTLPESVEGTTYGTQSVTHEIPKYYRTISISPTATYTGDKTKYPLANEVRKEIENPSTVVSSSPGTNAYELGKTSNTSYNTKQYYWTWDTTKTLYAMGVYSGNVGATYNLATPDKTVYYYLENRRVTENFVDTSGAKITPPTGFTQGKKTAITSDVYTFKQAGTLPDTYTTGGKTYKFKGWYKGKSILNTLTTTKAPSYQVTYDDNDDLNVVYEEETVTTFYPSLDVNFVNEKGGAFTPALTFSGKYYVRRNSDNVITNLYDVTSKSKGNGQYTVSINNGSVPLSQELFKKYTNGYLPMSPNSLAFRLDKLAIDQQLKYVDSIQVETAQSSGLNVYRYDYTNNSSTIIDSSVAPTVSNLSTANINGLNFTTDGTNFSHTSFNFLGMTIGSSMSSTGKYLFYTNLFSNNPTNDSKLVYKVTRKQVTENFVDANGAKITAPTGFTQGNQVPMNSNTFKYTAAQALPTTYTAGGKTYTFQGWYKGKTKPSTLNKTTTPTFNATFDGNDDMTAMYKEEIPMASVTLTRPKEVIDTNTNVIWTTTITNTSKAPLQNLTLKKGPNWSAGLTIPSFMEVTPEGGTTKSIPVTNTLWTDGVPVPNAVPVGKKVSIAFTTRATGRPNTVLKAEVVVFGGIKDSTVDNFVRIRPNDQEVVTPTTEGFISVPTFDFGQVGVAGSKQQHSLKQAADYYGNGTRNPYVRIKKTQPNWSLTAQLSQPKSATDNLPTATRLLLGAAPVSSFTNYNQPTELKNAVGTTSAISLTANNTATSIIANKQFTGSNVYQLDFTFNNVKLEVPANQGVKGQQYKAAVTWNLVTGP